ncbi:MAG: hypothetical protein LH702_08080 [Phormidesmis sp. CAN_BIN44]|nr:hypothetical protein [Phormidesmis sp. CAN_BIN44]
MYCPQANSRLIWAIGQQLNPAQRLDRGVNFLPNDLQSLLFCQTARATSSTRTL